MSTGSEKVPEGATGTASAGAETPDEGPPAAEPPRHGRRRLAWVLAGAATLVLVGAALAVALILPTDRQGGTAVAPSTTGADAASATTTVPTETSQPAETTLPGDTATTAAPPSPGGQWVEIAVPGLGAKAEAVAVSDEALVASTTQGLYALMIDGGAVSEPIHLPLTGEKTAGPTLDGTLVAWWEGTRQLHSKAYTDQAIYAMRLPDGKPVKVVGYDRSPYYPQLSEGYLTWVQPKPENGEATSSIWVQAIYGLPLDAGGSPQGEPTLLTSAPRAYVLSTQLWAYSFDGSLLAWEQHQAAEGLSPGVQLKDLTTGETTQLSEHGGRPSIAGPLVTYFGEALDGLDLTDKRVWTIDTRGDWATASDGFVVYLRSVRRQRYWEIVALRLSDGSEQILGQQVTLPWTTTPLAASKDHIAYVADDGTVKLFERRTD